MDRLKKIQLDTLKSSFDEKIDLLLCSSSFDERCLILMNSLDLSNIKKVSICHFENNYKASEDNLEKMKDISGEKAEVLILKKHNPITVCDEFCALLSDLPENATIVVDTTTLTRENLLILFKVLYVNFNSLKAYFSYTPSSAYYEQNVKPEEIWLSKGVRDIRTVLGYSGDFSAMKELLLIVLVGFEYERSEILIDAFEPAELYIGQSYDSTSENNELANINNTHFQKLKTLKPQSKTFSFSCIDIETTKKNLEDIIIENRDKYNIVISTMSNKMSTMASALITFEYPEVQICYASTNQYNIDILYSPCEHIYMFRLNDYYKK